MPSTALVTIIGLGVAAAILIPALSKYDGYFSDGPVFQGFFIGIVGGSIFGFLHSSLDMLAIQDPIMGLLILVLLFPIAQAMFKVVVVKRKKLYGKSDSMFVGLALGGGEGAFSIVYVLYFLYFMFASVAGVKEELVLVDYVTMLTLATSYILISGASGIACGLYSYKGDRMWLLQAIGVHSIYYLIVWVIGGLHPIAMALGLLVAIAMFMLLYKAIEYNIPPELERKMRRASRKKSSAKNTRNDE